MKDDICCSILIRAALSARKKAHSPYSRFAVGAAILTTDGETFAGCNIENSSYGLTVCAERVAIFKAISDGHHFFHALAIAVPGRTPMPPCGACLQVLSEFCERDMPVILVGAGAPGRPVRTSLNKLLPFAFMPDNLPDAPRC